MAGNEYIKSELTVGAEATIKTINLHSHNFDL